MEIEKYKSLKDHVYEFISDKISSGELQKDEKISEKIIMEELNVSRTPVREALIQLASDGYIVNIPRKGFVVKKVDLKKVAEIYQVMGILDSNAAILALPHLNQRDFRHMEMMINGMEESIKAGDFSDYYDLQLKFHEIYVQRCGNDELSNTIERLKKMLIRKNYKITNLEAVNEALKITNEQHKKILKLFKENKGEELAAYIKDEHWNAKYVSLETL